LAYGRKEKNGWALFLLILAGIIVGGFLGELAKDVEYLKWLNFGNDKSFGFKNPLALDLGILYLEFKLVISITLASIIGIALAIFIYRKL
jgi:hypothetical protein